MVKVRTVVPWSAAAPTMGSKSTASAPKLGLGLITSFTPPTMVIRSGCMASAGSSWEARISCSRNPRIAMLAYSSGPD